jgi:EmrB/QacA subfamily drug resistance transporter
VTDTRDVDSACCVIGGDEVVVVPWPLLLRARVAHRAHSSDRYRWWVLWTVLAGLFSVNVSFTILAVALPRIAREFHTTTNTMTWVITGPLLAFGVIAPFAGKLGDIYGHRRLYIIGIGGAAVAAALSTVAWSAGSLIAIRTLGSIEGAATGASSIALIARVFPAEDRVKAMGFWSLVGAGGPVIGVAIGGPIVQSIGWRWIFVGQVPLELIAVGFAAAILPSMERSTERRKLDVGGALSVTVSVTSLLLAMNRGPEWGWANPLVIGGFLLSPVAVAAFIWFERQAESPLIPLEFFRRPNFTFPIGAQVFGNFAYMGGFILAPTLLERLFGYGEAKAGLFVIARPLTFSIAAPIAGYVAVRIGERTSAVVGGIAVTASMLLFAAVNRGSGAWLVLAALSLSGLGLGIASPSLTASMANAVDHDSLGIASAAQQLMTQVGVVAGIQLISTVQAAEERSVGLSHSFQMAYLLGGAVSVLAIVCGLFVRSASRIIVPT